MKKFYADIVDPRVDNYISEISSHSDTVLKEMEEYANINNIPIVGPLVGRYLSQICLIKQPDNIFELGSGYGYSALWFAKSMKQGSKINCSDYSGLFSELAGNYFAKADQSEKLEFITGNSIDILKAADDKYDLIFNDIDKERYPEVIELAFEKLNPGGIFISDNVLWYGRVAEDNYDDLPSTKGVKEFNKKLFSSKGFFSTIIPLRDGLSLSVKL